MWRYLRRISLDNRQRCDDINSKQQIERNEMNVTQSNIEIKEELSLRVDTMSET